MHILSLTTSVVLALCMHMGWLHNNNVVVADRMVRMIFNDGVAPGTNTMCTAAELLLIDPIFNISTHERDLQRTNSSMTNNEAVTIEENDERELQFTKLSAKCRDNCAGFVPGACRATGCSGSRRRNYKRGLIETAHVDHRETSVWLSCYEQLNEINFALDTIVNSTGISQSCKNYLTKSKRRSECYDDIIYGEVVSFNFLNMIGGKIYGLLFLVTGYFPTVLQANVPNGYTVCSNIPINIEALVNPCVQSTELTLTGGPQSVNYKRTVNTKPMQIFTTSTPGSSYGGIYLRAGSYTFTATPDSMSYKMKRLDFQVIDCRTSWW